MNTAHSDESFLCCHHNEDVEVNNQQTGKTSASTIELPDAQKERIMDLLTEHVQLDISVVEAIDKMLGIKPCTRISSSRLLEFYNYALKIASELNVALPPLVIAEQGDLPERYGLRVTMLEDRALLKDIIYIVFTGRTKMLHSLAHELRHCWQEYKTDEYYKSYPTPAGASLPCRDRSPDPARSPPGDSR